MDAHQGRSRKRRRVDSSEEPERPQPLSIGELRRANKAKAMATTSADPSTANMSSIFPELHSIITCKICFRLMYEPFTVACGHTYCYSCLTSWFARTENRKMTCPDCRAVVKDAPAPAYTVREITQKFIQHAELLPEGETTEQHEENRAQETAILEADRSKPEVGLFNGRFRITIGWNGELRPRMRDEEDGVERCPHCFWELERGDGAICPRCGEAHDPGSDVTYESDGSNMTGSSYDESHMVHFHHAHHVHDHDHHHHHHHEHDEDLDEDDDMYDHEGFAGLDPHVGLEDLYEDGGEAYYISSDNEEDQGVRIRRAQAPPHRMPPIGRPQGREQTPIHIGSDSEGSSTAEFSPRISGNSPRRPPVRARRTVYSDEDDEEEDDESIGSMEDFLDDEEDLESGSSSTSSGSSGDELSDDDNIHSGPAPARAPITISIDEEDGSSSGRSQESDSDPLPDITQQQRRAYQEAMNRHAPRGGRRVRPWEAQPQSIRQARQAQQAVEVSDDEDSGGQGSSQAHEDELSSGGDENSSAGEEEEDDEDDPPVYSISRRRADRHSGFEFWTPSP